MTKNKRVLIFAFRQESNTFNPLVMPLREFLKTEEYTEGTPLYEDSISHRHTLGGIIAAVEENGGEVIPAFSLTSASGARISDEVLDLAFERLKYYVEASGPVDAVCAALHGATCAESEDDACGALLEHLRSLVGENIPIAAACDLHANITPRMLLCADVICGYQTYPHLDFYETGYRAASLCMRLLRGEPLYMAAAHVPMMVPPSGYTTLDEPFKGVIDCGKEMTEKGKLLDFTVFNVQAWLDIPVIASTAIAVAEDAETAKRQADILAEKLFSGREAYWPELMSVDEILDKAEDPASHKPVILVDSADSPNGGAVGDSPVAALRALERGSSLRIGMFVRDPEAVAQAFALGVGGSAEFSVGSKFTPGLPGPLKAAGKVRSLHDGIFRREGPAGRGSVRNIGRSAVVSFGSVDILLCEHPVASGDPQILRHFGIEPTLYDLIVVKANTSFRVPYSKFADTFCVADTPGAGAANLMRFEWKNMPKGFYPFDLPEDYKLKPALIWRHREK